jgi:phenylacetate-CoA ligase
MIRMASGDLTRWVDDTPPCGRTYPWLPDGIFGRIDDMFTVRGENVYPSEIDAVLNALPGYGGEHQIIISRDAAMDELVLKVEPDAATSASASGLEGYRSEVAHRLQNMLGLRTVVDVVAPGSLPRTDFKARRVVDDRAVFRQMHAQLSREH